MMEAVRILVIDDEEGMRLGCRKVLERRGFEVKTAADGAEGLSLLRSGGIDLALVDYKLPDRDGMSILDEVRSEGLDVPCIMITAYATLESAVAATKKGAYDFLAKPFTPAELNAAVDKAVEYIRLQREAKRLKEEKKRVRLEFVRIVSHELKAPLATIEGYLTNLLEGYAGDDPEAWRRILERCKLRAEGMRKLIEDLLDLTRIESGSKESRPEEMDLAALLDDIVEVFEPQAERKKVVVEKEYRPPIPMFADVGELRIVFTNLVSNAIKYNREGGKVTVKAAREGDEVTVEVSDTGIGIREEDRKKLFTEFFRARTPETRNIPGSGLGLAIVRKLVELGGGRIEVESEYGKGTTFRVTLPARREG
ncbi:MAG: hypothetical protein DRP90_03760 [Planctomycetota bacterium]|nr:MAG: hypothetical protein DRP90_03760 [Planctomycetota bacterium]